MACFSGFILRSLPRRYLVEDLNDDRPAMQPLKAIMMGPLMMAGEQADDGRRSKLSVHNSGRLVVLSSGCPGGQRAGPWDSAGRGWGWGLKLGWPWLSEWWASPAHSTMPAF